MDGKKIKIETGEDKKNAEELLNLKKEMAERIVDKIGKKYNYILFSFGKGKELMADYLVDEGWEDALRDLLIEKFGIDLLGYTEQLKSLRSEIKKIESKEALASLEKKIIDDLENGNDNDMETKGETVGLGSTQQVVTPISVPTTSIAATSVPLSNENDNSDVEVSVDSAKVGEAKEIPLKKRMEWLFPEGVPQTKKQMKKYLERIEVIICTPEGKKEKMKLEVHKKLANEFKAIFQELFNKSIPINPKSTACFNRRKMRKSKKMSHHSYGSAVDVNWDVNGGVYGPTEEKSPYYNGSETVDIRKKHGFYWGGDWSKRNNDPMHFTYMNA